jgi:hypothetical protein
MNLIYRLLDNIWFRADITLFQVPFHISPPHIWFHTAQSPGNRIGIFRKRVGGSYNKNRWGGHLLGFEIGSRGNPPPAVPGIVYTKIRYLVEKLTNLSEKR